MIEKRSADKSVSASFFQNKWGLSHAVDAPRVSIRSKLLKQQGEMAILEFRPTAIGSKRFATRLVALSHLARTIATRRFSTVVSMDTRGVDSVAQRAEIATRENGQMFYETLTE
ncbi:hypothetical protein [Lactococcus protaetiae]|uniref:Uncharacterized protein n=1 Tax=Lactococcus protaetiae TaxID=2592653 RepID=A0A514Z9Z5_9LACT|nr:hypothetical protein [Lactococcus protaetiae]QDK71408.1 hypothetical protein FLP15_09875 [Lactococcus protaetiae]